VTTFASSSVSATGQSGPTSQRLALRYGRTLPVSLPLKPNAKDHVFRSVVVNQKAAPIGRALLGTIVSTGLRKEELERGSSRSTNAGIALEGWTRHHLPEPQSGEPVLSSRADGESPKLAALLPELVHIDGRCDVCVGGVHYPKSPSSGSQVGTVSCGSASSGTGGRRRCSPVTGASSIGSGVVMSSRVRAFIGASVAAGGSGATAGPATTPRLGDSQAPRSQAPWEIRSEPRRTESSARARWVNSMPPVRCRGAAGLASIADSSRPACARPRAAGSRTRVRNRTRADNHEPGI
jgi:hypothetical protein